MKNGSTLDTANRTPARAGTLWNPPEPTPAHTGTLRNLPALPSGTYTSTRRNPPKPSRTCLRNLHQHTPEFSGTFWNLPPEPAPATRTGTHRSLSGLKTPLAYAVEDNFSLAAPAGISVVLRAVSPCIILTSALLCTCGTIPCFAQCVGPLK